MSSEESRLRTLGEAKDRMLEVHTLCMRHGLWMACSVPTHWRFGHPGSDKTRLSYWPSSQKMQRHPGTKVSQQVTVDELMRELGRLAQR